MSKRGLAVVSTHLGAEAQASALRSLPKSKERWRPTVSIVIYNIVDSQVVLCTSRNNDPLDLDALKFPQEGIHARIDGTKLTESVTDAFLRGAEEELGLDSFRDLHDLSGGVLIGKKLGGRRKVLFPMLGVTDNSARLNVEHDEVGGADWYDLDYAEKVIGAQPDNRRCRNARAILQRLTMWTETADCAISADEFNAGSTTVPLANTVEIV